MAKNDIKLKVTLDFSTLENQLKQLLKNIEDIKNESN